VDVQTDYRAAAVGLMEDYAQSASVKLQTYPGRPMSVNAPCGFVDRMGATIDPIGPGANYQITPSCELIILHGPFDSKDAADQRDAFVDGFVQWVAARYHEAGSNSLIAVTRVEDEPTYVTDWMPPDRQRTYYGTRITLEGYVGDN